MDAQRNSRIIMDANGDEWLVYNGQKQRIWRDLFTYQVGVFSNIAAAAAATNQITIQADSDFEWTHACYQFSLANAAYLQATRPQPNCRVLITDQGSGRQLMNASVPVMSIFGMPEQPWELPISKVFGRNSTIGFTVTNFDAAVNTGQLWLSCLGYKIFYY